MKETFETRSVGERLQIIVDILDGLSYVHDLGLNGHLNLKPTNILLRDSKTKLQWKGDDFFVKRAVKIMFFFQKLMYFKKQGVA